MTPIDDLKEVLGRSPELFPYGLDAGKDSISFVRLTRSDYETASFLDARVLTPQSAGRTLPWPQVAAAIEAAQLAEHCAFIFHIGHVGSTLLSRLIGAHPGALALREPLLLRTFTELHSTPAAQPRGWRPEEFEARLSGCLKLLSRTFDGGQIAVLKATSFVSEFAAALLSRSSGPRAVMMYVCAESYLATILGGPNSRQEAKLLAPGRWQRLYRRMGSESHKLAPLGEGEMLALGWACETSALARAAAANAARVLKIDFERFLAEPEPVLAAAFRHLGIETAASTVASILAGPDMHRYSKAPEYAYDTALRHTVLSEARAAHGAEIQRGLAWLDRAAEQFAVVREALAFAA